MKTRHLFSKGAVLLGGAPIAIAALALVAELAVDAAGAATPPAAVMRVADATSPPDATGADAAQSRNAARSRMRECGHQWSTMKKNGTASGMTWKEFSQGCLAKQ